MNHTTQNIQTRIPGGEARLQKLHQVHKDIIRMHLLGISNKEIASQLGITPIAVSYTISSPIVQAELAEKNAILDDQVMLIKSRIEELKPLAINALNQILISDNASFSVKRATAMDILDTLGGESAPRHFTLNNNLTVNEINIIKSRATEAIKSSGLLAEMAVQDTEIGVVDTLSEEAKDGSHT